MKFNVGDMVRYVGHAPCHGEVTEILAVEPAEETVKRGGWVRGELICQLNLPATANTTKCGWAHPRDLVPIYDGHEPCEFDAEIWSPHKVTEG